jgi:nitrate reductase NapE
VTGRIDTEPPAHTPAPAWRAEFVTFLVLAFGVWPFVAVGVVGGLGLAIWVTQMIFGPPGPPPPATTP